MKIKFENIYKSQETFIFLPTIGFDFEYKYLTIAFLIFAIHFDFGEH